jgi:excisionase family DNA binding protein
MPQIMTKKEIAKYLKLHEITICKYAVQGRIPAIRIGRVWRFDKDAIDKWIGEGSPPLIKAGSKGAKK